MAWRSQMAMSPPDPKTVFTLDQANGLFLAAMARPDCAGSGILHPDSLAADGSWRAPIGTGPFTLGKWQKGQYVELDRFKEYTPRAEAEADGYTGNKQAFVDKVRFEGSRFGLVQAAASGGVDLLRVTAMDAAQSNSQDCRSSQPDNALRACCSRPFPLLKTAHSSRVRCPGLRTDGGGLSMVCRGPHSSSPPPARQRRTAHQGWHYT